MKRPRLSGVILALCAFFSYFSSGYLVSAQPSSDAMLMYQIEVTDDPCAPAVAAIGGEGGNIRRGPGTEYDILTTAPADSVYLIRGRAELRRYWQIDLGDSTLGWVFADIVTVTGDIAPIPIVEPPLQNGALPTGDVWTPQSETPPCSSAGDASAEAVATEVAGEPTPPTTTIDNELIPQTTHAVTEESYLPWSLPQNLSSSGVATDPILLQDSDSAIHLLWQNRTLGFRYSQAVLTESATRWRQPTTIGASLPFTVFSPSLVADQEGHIFAFWQDADGVLWESHVTAAAFIDPIAWSEPTALALSAHAFVAKLGSDDRLHVAFIGAIAGGSGPAGVFYQAYDANTQWSDSQLVAQSEYLRNVEGRRISIDLLTSELGNRSEITLVWENPLLQQIEIGQRPLNGSSSWTLSSNLHSTELTSALNLSHPRQPILFTTKSSTLLLWQQQTPTTGCLLFSRELDHDSNSWGELNQIAETLVNCSYKIQQIKEHESGIVSILVSSQLETFLIGWQAGDWSQPQRQDPLIGIFNSLQGELIELGCHNALLTEENQLLVVGCTTTGLQDIWALSRELAGMEDWFGAPSPWVSAGHVYSGTIPIQHPQLLNDRGGVTHALWTHTDISTQGHIQYARLELEGWTAPITVGGFPAGPYLSMEASIISEEKIWVVVQNMAGELFSSFVHVDEATRLNAWSNPVLLPIPAGIAAYDLTSNHNTVAIAYSKPFNEERGVYLLISEDDGQSWSSATPIFLGEPNNWEGVGSVSIALDGDANSLHIMFEQLTLVGQAQSTVVGLFAIDVLLDNAIAASPVEIARAETRWHEITLRDKEIHRFWLVNGEPATSIWHQYSVDGGQNWEDAMQLMLADGQPEVLQYGNDLYLLLQEHNHLRFWQWADEKWSLIDSEMPLNSDHSDVYGFEATLSADGRLSIGYAESLAAMPGELFTLFTRMVDVIQIISTTNPESEPLTPETTTDIRDTEATSDVINLELGNSFSKDPPRNTSFIGRLPGGNSDSGQLLYAVAPAVLLGALLVILVRYRRRQTD